LSEKRAILRVAPVLEVGAVAWVEAVEAAVQG
jgi:hypothetical protein